MHIIKRYTNRKLYDTQAGCYITLEEIRQAVRQGEDLRVLDHASGADLTTLTLLQVVLEGEKKEGGWLPHQMLARLIRAGEMRADWLRKATAAWLDPGEAFDREVRRRVELLAKQGRLEESEAGKWLELLLDPDLREAQAEEPIETATSAEIQTLIAEIERLQAAVDDLIAK